MAINYNEKNAWAILSSSSCSRDKEEQKYVQFVLKLFNHKTVFVSWPFLICRLISL